MKHIVRAAVVVLVLTGAAASTQISATPSNTAKVTVARNSALPTPMCAPDDPNGCGMR